MTGTVVIEKYSTAYDWRDKVTFGNRDRSPDACVTLVQEEL